MSLPSRRIPAARLRRAAEQVGREVGCRLVVLFGSAARGADGATAAARDLDVGVLCDTVPDLVALTNRFIQALGVQAVDLTDLRRADPLLLMLVARDGTPLYERAPGEFARFASLAARRYADTRKFRVAERDAVRDFIARSPTRP
jgi:predicted nucleotidyltransferase